MWIEALTTLRVVTVGEEEPRWLREGDDAVEVDAKTGAELVGLQAAAEVDAPAAPAAAAESTAAASKKKAGA